jgi:Condensation domain
LLRITLVQLKLDSYALLLTMHHIIGDGWSMGVFIKELSSLYRGFLVGEPFPLPELPIQYAYFTIWQRQWLQEKALQNPINYWKQQLAAAHLCWNYLRIDHALPYKLSGVGAFRFN